MITYITENIGTIVTGLVLAGIVTLIIAKMIKDKKKGKIIGCSCGCSECSDESACSGQQGAYR